MANLYKFLVLICMMQVDYEMALEYATHRGVTEEPRENVYIQSLGVENKFIDLHAPNFVFRLFQ